MKYLVLFIFCNSAVSPSLNCPSSKWFQFRNKCYLADVNKQYSFQENVDFCKSLNATIVSIHSTEENNFIKNHLYLYGRYWLGIAQIDFKSQTYKWLDGSVYNYHNWGYQEGQKDCPGAYMRDGKWYDYTYCNNEWSVFCQIEFDSTLYQINQSSQDLKLAMKAMEARLNESDTRLNEKISTMNILMTNLNQKNVELNLKLNKTEFRLNESISKLQNVIDSQNELITKLTSAFEVVPKPKVIQVKNSELDLELTIRSTNQTSSWN